MRLNNVGVSRLSDLSDVEITNPYNGATLQYDLVSGKWKNVGGTPPSTGFPVDGCIAYYRMDDLAATIVADVLETYDGTQVSGTPEEEGIINTGYSYTASTYDTLPNTLATFFNDDCSFSCWVKLGSTSTFERLFIYYASDNTFVAIDWTGSGWEWIGNLSSASGWSMNGGSASTGTWYHLVGVREGSTAKLYLDGTLLLSGSITGTGGVTAGGDFYIGGFNGSQGLINGNLDEIGIWNRALTAEEVQALYNDGVGVSYPTA